MEISKSLMLFLTTMSALLLVGCDLIDKGDFLCEGYSRVDFSSAGASGGSCEWTSPSDGGVKGSCVVTKVFMFGDGTRPDAASITVGRRGSSDDAESASRSASASGDGWNWTGNNLNCSAAGCASGTYYIKIPEPSGGSCSDFGVDDMYVEAS